MEKISLNELTIEGITHPLFWEFVGLYRAKTYEWSGGSHCPNFSRWLFQYESSALIKFKVWIN